METGGGKYDRCNWPDPSNETGQHFLLTKASRDLKPDVLWEMSDEEAYATFCAFRWSANRGNAFCPKCGDKEPYAIRRRRFRCSDPACMREFSVTSGTVFHSRKPSFKKIIMAIWEELAAVKGMAALHLTRKINVEYKTAWVLLSKIREAIGFRRERMKLWGTVQIDGKYIGGHIKPENKKGDRIDRRKKENQNGKRMCVLSLRQHNRGAPNMTFTRVVLDENAKAAWAAARDYVEVGATLIADEHGSYDDLQGLAELRRVNHSEAYQTEDGTNTNAIEGFFARVERAYVGIHHRFSVKYLDWYMAMIAWKEDTRYMGVRWQMADILRTVTHRTVSRNLKGYWRRAARRIDDQVWLPDTPRPEPKYLL
jgi:transposase-like protein